MKIDINIPKHVESFFFPKIMLQAKTDALLTLKASVAQEKVNMLSKVRSERE